MLAKLLKKDLQCSGSGSGGGNSGEETIIIVDCIRRSLFRWLSIVCVSGSEGERESYKYFYNKTN